MINHYQPLDLTVTGFTKLFLKERWFSLQISKEFDKEPLPEISIFP